ncbi:MAG: metallophosphoesterase family protein [Candidatus Kapaibacterium sp.]
MRKVVHISDLHFGAVNEKAERAIVRDINEISPDLLVVSGDMTMRAKTKQFMQAEEFLSKFDSPIVAIPGNHDISLFNIFRRFYKPLKRFRKFITDHKFPAYEDDEIAAFGINTARSLTIKGGRVSKTQIKEAREKLCSIDEGKFKILVIHHNIIPTPGSPDESFLGRANLLLDEIEDCRLDMMLAGHVHRAYIEYPESAEPGKKFTILLSAGTAISTRTRNEPNSFNLLEIDGNVLDIKIMSMVEDKFIPTVNKRFLKEEKDWKFKEETVYKN